MFHLLSPQDIPEGDLIVFMKFAFSSLASDLDNPVKPFLDILQKYYGFDDKRVVEMHLSKVKVKKGHEFIAFDIEDEEDYR